MADKKAAKKPAVTRSGKPKPASKSETLATLAEKTDLTKKQVGLVLTELENLIKAELSKKGRGVFALPGLIKLERVKKPATKEKTVRNPRTGEMMTVGPKPERTVIKARVLKNLKELVK